MKDGACIVGAFEHPTRHAPDKSVADLHVESALGALADAGLGIGDVDGYFWSGMMPNLGIVSLIDYMNLSVRHFDSTDVGGASPLVHVKHAVEAIAAGKCNVALITLAGRPRSDGQATGTGPRQGNALQPDSPWEAPFGPVTSNIYGMCAMRHMHEFGTTAEQLAWVKVAASHHAQHNERAVLRDVVTIADVLASPIVSDPLHRLDCCVITDGGGALVVARPEIAGSLGRPLVRAIGMGEAVMGQGGGYIDVTISAGAMSAPRAFEQAGVARTDIKYASIYDSFTITVVIEVEDLGFCEKGRGGAFVADGNLISGVGKLPWNTDGGGLCNNHPANRGGMTKIIEAVRQLRGEAHRAVQVPNCDLALVHGTGGLMGSRHSAATLILERQ